MPTVSQALRINDGMTPILRNITNAMNLTISAFERMKNTSKDPIVTASLNEARNKLNDVTVQINEAEKAQEKFNKKIQESNNFMSGLKGVVAGVVGAFSVGKIVDFAFGSMDLANIQNASETQLKAVLANVGASESAFDNLKTKASEIQSKGIYGDEAMLAGAAELSTYISDEKAIASMMDTLSNYAMGMSGGGEVNKTAMVDYATQLGKALDGTYDGLKKKGFELSEEQKKIIENGTDMEKALVLDEVIAQSWDGLYETMSQTPESSIIQVKNMLGDLRENLGNSIYPAVMRIYQLIIDNQDTIEKVFNGISTGLQVMFWVLGGIFEFAFSIAGFFTDNWSAIEPIIWALVGALVAYNAVILITNALEGAQAIAEGIKGASMMMSTGATFGATAAQWGFNAALLACPITWIVVLIIALVAVLIYLWNTNDDVARAMLFAWDSLQIGLMMVVLGLKAGFFGFLDVLGYIKIGALTIIDNLINGAIDKINGFIELLNKIPGVSIDLIANRSNLATNAAAEFAKEKAERDAELADDALNIWNKAEEMNATREERVENRQKLTLDSLMENAFGSEGGFNINDIMSGKQPLNVDEVENVKNVSGSVDVSSEDLKLLREMAEQDYIQNYIYIDPDVAINTGDINENADLDYLMRGIGSAIRESIDTGLEGVPVG